VTLTDAAQISAGDTAVVAIATGDLSLGGTSKISGGDVVEVAVQTGDVSLTQDASMMSGGVLNLSVTTGDVSLTDGAVIAADETLNIAVETGDVSLSGSSNISSSGDATVSIGTGDLTLIENSAVGADADLEIDIGTGLLGLNDGSVLRAGDTLDIGIANGALTMEDADTLITATDINIQVLAGLTPDQQGDVRIDLIVGLNSTRIEALGGAVLDNTASELIDNIVSPELNLVASDGIGLEWEDNLNVNTQLLSVLNTTTGGINIQNRTGLTIAPEGVRNFAAGDVVIIADGPINHLSSGYSFDEVVEAGGVFTIPGQRIILLSNHMQPYFDANWGNTSRIAVLDAVGAGSTAQSGDTSFASISELLGRFGLFDLNVFSYGRDAFDRFLDRFNFDRDEEEEEIRPIQIAEFVLQNIQESIALAQIAQAEAEAAVTQSDEIAAEATANEQQPEDVSETVTLLPEADAVMSQDVEDSIVIEPQVGDTPPIENPLDRPVILQAMLLADDEIDQPLIAAE
jgi:hypothetical protein